MSAPKIFMSAVSCSDIRNWLSPYKFVIKSNEKSRTKTVIEEITYVMCASASQACIALSGVLTLVFNSMYVSSHHFRLKHSRNSWDNIFCWLPRIVKHVGSNTCYLFFDNARNQWNARRKKEKWRIGDNKSRKINVKIWSFSMYFFNDELSLVS